MATGKLNFLKRNQFGRNQFGQSHGRNFGRRGLRYAVICICALILIFAVVYGTSIRSTALAGSAFGARVGCSCHFVGGRKLKDCRKDFEPGMAMVMLSSNENAKTVTARVPLIASQTASFREGEGCVLEKWTD